MGLTHRAANTPPGLLRALSLKAGSEHHLGGDDRLHEAEEEEQVAHLLLR